ncbi:MAG: glycosyltransferase family 4 protein [Lachnospiraceae bacterium]
MKKKVWILNHHANDMFFDEGGRHYNFAKYLKTKGYEPVIFCSNAQHGTGKLYFDNDKIWDEKINKTINVPFVFVKGRPYVGNGRNRILCMIDYYKNVKKAAKEYAIISGKPDIIIGSQVHPLAVLAAENIADSFGVKCIAEFRDLWPESIVAIGMASKYNPIILAMRMLEKRLYKKADAIVFTVEGGYDYISDRKWDKLIPKTKVYYINNGVDLENYQKNTKSASYKDADLDNTETFKIIYTGSIRQANGLDVLIECAAILRDDEHIKFLIYGDGDYREELQNKVRQKGLENVLFKRKVDKSLVPYILSKSNVNLLNYNAAAAEGFYRYGSSQNKLFEYLASGKPILSNFKANYDLIDRYGCGISKKFLNAEQYANALKEIIGLPEEKYKAMCDNALKAAADYDFKILTDMLIDVIESI